LKKRELERRLRLLGWYLLREGASHEIWSNGEEKTALPRHREINELTALAILRVAKRAKK
jgi:mRNA interferase HicA